MGAVAQHALTRAADALSGSDLAAVCAAFGAWRAEGQRELPWLAGPGLSALAELSIPTPEGPDAQVLQRFLVGAETAPATVSGAIAPGSVTAAPEAPSVPPDARAALVGSVERYFGLLVDAYTYLHAPVARADREMVEELCRHWQSRLDDAAAQIEERGRVLRGLRQPAVAATRSPARPSRDRTWYAIAFVGIALAIAGLMLWAVTHGWPMEAIDLGI